MTGAIPLLAAVLRVGTFQVDATPPLGQPLIWVAPAARVLDPLLAKGVVLSDGRERFVLCALDWCGVGGATYQMLRQALAAGARTNVDKVALQSVHQHTAPYVEGDGMAVLRRSGSALLLMSDAYLAALAARLRQAAGAVRLEPFDTVGVSRVEVVRVASARRIFKDGTLVTRFSGSGKDPAMAALPEGPIDPVLRTITLGRSSKPLVRLHYYATHPQTFCCEGTVTSDFAGAARQAFEKSDGAFQVYFTGCAGDITAGKYNDGTLKARTALAARLEQAMRLSAKDTQWMPAGKVRWRAAGMRLPPKLSKWSGSESEQYRAAIVEGFAKRTEPLPASALRIGRATIVNLPGEPMLEFQNFAGSVVGGGFVAVAGYGDISPGYLCTDEAHRQGGYEPSAANAGPGTEALVKKVIRELLED